MQVQRATDRDTAYYRILYQEKNFLLTSYSRKVMRFSKNFLSALKLATVRDSTYKQGLNVLVSVGKRTPLIICKSSFDFHASFQNELCTKVWDYVYICLVADFEKPLYTDATE